MNCHLVSQGTSSEHSLLMTCLFVFLGAPWTPNRDIYSRWWMPPYKSGRQGMASSLQVISIKPYISLYLDLGFRKSMWSGLVAHSFQLSSKGSSMGIGRTRTSPPSKQWINWSTITRPNIGTQWTYTAAVLTLQEGVLSDESQGGYDWYTMTLQVEIKESHWCDQNG